MHKEYRFRSAYGQRNDSRIPELTEPAYAGGARDTGMVCGLEGNLPCMAEDAILPGTMRLPCARKYDEQERICHGDIDPEW